jgi:flagellar biogenesis protein FliO
MEDVLHAVIGRAEAREPWAARLWTWLRRFACAASGDDAPLRVEARVTLGPRKSLVLVNCCGRRLLVSVGGDAIAPLLEVTKSARRKGVGP